MSSLLTIISITAISCFTIFLISVFVDYRLKKWVSDVESPVSAPTLKAVLFLSFGLLISEFIETVKILQTVLSNTNVSIDVGNSAVLKEITMIGAFFSIILLIYIILVVLAALMHKLIRLKSPDKKSIFVTVANNEFYDLILFGAILLTLTLAVKTGISPLLDSYIPYPEVPNFR